ncbi:hypothetical protein TNCV_1812521 [Trichonephila clavipes]|uniref:Uncharacterized protein n=1 Tax=Trichonephila clavipes TaxID=2585209 RepID=A0A8X7BGN4_TRICX|nr:hypothetical protein TNCV_1812521 [Trichonephila clavipes]
MANSWTASREIESDATKDAQWYVKTIVAQSSHVGLVLKFGERSAVSGVALINRCGLKLRDIPRGASERDFNEKPIQSRSNFYIVLQTEKIFILATF